MKPKPILIIDDKLSEVTEEIADPLKRLGYQVELIENPETGLKVASHRYLAIFIDFRFSDEHTINGADVCYRINDVYPLLPLVLLTAYGKDHIDDFLNAPWNSYCEKGKLALRPSLQDAYVNECLVKAINHAANIVKFDINQERANTIQAYKDLLSKLNQFFVDDPKAALYDNAYIAKVINAGTRSNLVEKFQIKESGNITKRSLLVRHILVDNEAEWEEARKHFSPLKALIEYYSI
ncbi:hypothetical protein HQ865_00785 [Mucilaginibacter mali]|uniref:Response regulatory domain-containing protein n=1 Tax=Mucilaginibacter mali TaxID=2740462 RepID=A0A7D4TLK3_9SPHI|nr:hypothetical protein [Mucilaginibacter mali]QKJ28354.1 hypothetical protein HQ865_00785 [Mucilaginibacter mali]